uniref:BRI3 binding protein n=1 Tax=Molossus molossus TaxID=27622 RepID=A0A7J8BW76_MOLMO|nr:BRI3 binding protein [Molossus molossus]
MRRNQRGSGDSRDKGPVVGAGLVYVRAREAWVDRASQGEKETDLTPHTGSGLNKFLTRLTERFVLGVDMFLETLWKVWTEILDVLGLDVSNMSQYFSPASVASSPARALMLVGVIVLAYWFLSLTLGFTFSLLHVVFGRFFWVVRVVLFSMSCVYILHKHQGEPENAALPLCFVVAVYFMTGPMGWYWRGGPSGPSVEEKLEHLENQVRLLNIRLNRVLESLDRANGK